MVIFHGFLLVYQRVQDFMTFMTFSLSFHTVTSRQKKSASVNVAELAQVQRPDTAIG
jgi:hypothetical protein